MSAVEATRAEMASMLVTALEASARERDLSETRVPTSGELARVTYAKLQFDFPLVSPAGLDCLAKEMEAEIVSLASTQPSGTGVGLRAGNSGSSGPYQYKITNALVTAVVEGASRTAADTTVAETKETSAIRNAFQKLLATVLIRAPYRLLAVRDTEADEFLSQYHVPVGDAMMRVDGGNEDADEHDEDATSEPDAQLDCLRVETRDTNESNVDGANERDDEIENDDSDDGSDWEPLESDPSTLFDESTTQRNKQVQTDEPHETRVDRKLGDLLSKARGAFLDATAETGERNASSFEDGDEKTAPSRPSSSTSAWTSKGITSCATALVLAFCSKAGTKHRPTRAYLLHHPLRLLRERWNVFGVCDDLESDALRTCLTALGFGREENGCETETETENKKFALETIGVLCARFVFSPERGGGTHFASATEEETSARALWKTTAHFVPAIATALDKAVRGFTIAKSKKIETSESLANVGACSASLAFYAARAAGNARVGELLLKSGAVRAAVGLFCAAEGRYVEGDTGEYTEFDQGNDAAGNVVSGARNDFEKTPFGCSDDPSAEATRRLLLLASAASSEVTEFLLAVPGVLAVIEAHAPFSGNGKNAAHGALWELVFASAGNGHSFEEKKDAETRCAERFAAVLADQTAVVDALGLLRLVQLASLARVHSAPVVFGSDTDGGLHRVLRETATARAAVVTAAAATRAQFTAAAGAGTRKPSGSDDESDGERENAAPTSTPPPKPHDQEFEKHAHAASNSLRLIKEIVDGFAGGAGARKCD